MVTVDRGVSYGGVLGLCRTHRYSFRLKTETGDRFDFQGCHQKLSHDGYSFFYKTCHRNVSGIER